MALNAEVSFTWLGHGTWKVRSARGKDVLIDAWVMNNPATPDTLKTIDKCDLMLITHGHFDHIHDALEIARRTKPTIVTNHEIGVWLGSKQGIDGERIVAGNQGGTIDVEGIKVTLVQAVHSCGITEEGGIVYGGDAQGLVIEFENGFTIYFAGDTEGIPEMRALKNIDVAFVCMNLPYTMPPEEAADAVKAFHPKVVIPYHYRGSDLAVFKKALEGTGIEVRLLDWYPK